ncbi:unnamed protein product [Schistosoma margrebowiei]|uniref:Uncharacterized protein n=1 Tax=Schistosoma margrebowiei TaxID=48269 RepID=A0A183NAG8_9TREM|nr:unnamed protein product [Schistosoma margrebowiei]
MLRKIRPTKTIRTNEYNEEDQSKYTEQYTHNTGLILFCIKEKDEETKEERKEKKENLYNDQSVFNNQQD